MYLKAIELVGFKSFANPTRLDFEPGMTAIVGPNGCGKSNVLDAIRWVIGEQSAKILRGTKMEDFIFSGTDTMKPLGMAEVSITFADCEKILGSDYNEVTVSRRVYRSGEGEYFMNKVPCRLKDIQRLFMDTGIGTTSYSIMEQGRIDQILSSRPEDRREIFEEASGITKFKTDKTEALRKLEQTEANLLRLTDVIAEVKRQIISLERQAGKARRYKAAFEELRKLDVFATQQRLATSEKEIGTLKTQLASLDEQVEAARSELDEIEKRNSAIRQEMARYELRVDELMQARNDASSRLERTRDSIEMNNSRIAESKQQMEREAAEMERLGDDLKRQREAYARLSADLDGAKKDLAAAGKRRDEKLSQLASHEESTENNRKLVEGLQTRGMELENQFSNLQNELIRLDSGKRADAIRRERLEAEKLDLERQLSVHMELSAEATTAMETIEAECSARAASLSEIEKSMAGRKLDHDAMREEIAKLQSVMAARRAEISLLGGDDPDNLPKEARAILSDAGVPAALLDSISGTLGSMMEVDPPYRRAAEAVLHERLDALVLAHPAAARDILAALEGARKGGIRLLAPAAHTGEASSGTHTAEGPGRPLLEHVKAADRIRGLLAGLLAGVRVVDSLSEIPSPAPCGSVFVTMGGAVVRGDGEFEFWSPEGREMTSMARNARISDARLDLASLEAAAGQCRDRIAQCERDMSHMADAMAAARAAVLESRQQASSKNGERQVMLRQADQIRSRIETVTWELESLRAGDGSFNERKQELVGNIAATENQRKEIRVDIEARSRAVLDMDRERASMSSETIEARHRCTELEQRCRFLDEQAGPMTRRIDETEDNLKIRRETQAAREASLRQFEQAVADASGRIAGLQELLASTTAELQEVRRCRQDGEAELAKSDKDLAARRIVSDGLKDRKSQVEIHLAEAGMRRQNTIEKVTADYSMTLDDVLREPEPEWEESRRPETEWMDSRIGELKAKIDAMGPVNLTAIEEHQELNERFEFLNKQQADLVDSKQKLIAMINKINKTTSEMFAQTFDLVNKNFDAVFAKLFNGGSAKLVLVNEEDILESGIEIIARPPGKKLQSVSLLSGGERTLTAVSLLFAIYMVKPSPFCVLDELDAPLDESNIGRFVNILNSFMDKSQFLLITHNQQTIAAAGAIYGVTMQEKGVSRIVSMKLDDNRSKVGKAAFVVETAPAPVIQ